jgi:hypothetical protein
MKDLFVQLLVNRKTYLAAAGLAGLGIWQFSQQDYVGLVGTATAIGTMLGLHVQFPDCTAEVLAVAQDLVNKRLDAAAVARLNNDVTIVPYKQ